MNTLKDFSKKVSFHEYHDSDHDYVVIKTAFVLQREDRITDVVIKAQPDAKKFIQQKAVRLMFQELFGERREIFYRLLNDIRFEATAPTPAFLDAINCLKTLFD